SGSRRARPRNPRRIPGVAPSVYLLTCTRGGFTLRSTRGTRMSTPTFEIVNQSKTYTPPPGWFGHADEALGMGLKHVATAWSEAAYHIVEQARKDGLYITLVDELPEAPGALGYHDLDKDGKPFIRIGLKVIMDNGGDWLTGSTSVTSVIDHETKELVGD